MFVPRRVLKLVTYLVVRPKPTWVEHLTFTRRHNIQFNHVKHNDTQHNHTKCDPQHKDTCWVLCMLSCASRPIMLSAFMFCVVMLNVAPEAYFIVRLLGSYSQPFIFFASCKYTQKARVFIICKPF